MNKSRLRKLVGAVLAAALSFSVSGCANSSVDGLARGAARGWIPWVTEAYIQIRPFSSEAKPVRSVFPGRDEVAMEAPVSDEKPEKTPPKPAGSVNNEDDRKATLTEETYADVTLYRIDDTEYFMRRPLGVDPDVRAGLKNGVDFVNDLAAKNSGVDFYAYYVTRSEEYDWYSGYTFYDYPAQVEKGFAAAGLVEFDSMKLADLDDYFATGYKTDFHVNNRGSHRIYQDLYALLSGKQELSAPVEILSELDGGWKMVGDLFDNASYAAAYWTDESMDDFRAYVYELPEYKSFIYDTQTKLGMEEEYAADEIPNDPRFWHQFVYYGGQTGEIRFEFNQQERKNLLIISDSQGRPTRLQIASHFNTTVYLDDVQVRRLNVNEIIEKYNIEVVLFMGQRSMFEFYG